MASNDPQLSVAHRVAALAKLEATAWELNQLASWLGNHCETEADMIESAARSILAAAWLLERPLRPQLPPQQWRAERP